MKYNVTGQVPLVINDKYVMPGEVIDSGDLPTGTNIGALVEGGHLEKVVTRRAKPKEEGK